ncbi:PREDICTED: cell division control protein 6 homolog B-like [Nicotiana attenuata]|uniref:Cell division control protein n=1 Tax=Nicotiana attenuata TaxID=49451 RepID=A0A314KWQ3_NICAT|nr:PREDICTED: cell division control protein 6 homolog B-like [Nicotiana attenuata]OIT33836.1 cell division control protein 6 -like b [Nicotiana attenuata]
MPAIPVRRSPRVSGGSEVAGQTVIRNEIGVSTPSKRKIRSNSTSEDDVVTSTITPSPMEISPCKWKSPRRCVNDSPKIPPNVNCGDKAKNVSKSPVKRRLSESFLEKPMWNPRDMEQLNAVKEALHVSRAPSNLVCRQVEQNRVLEFCKQALEKEKAGSLYVCGCPGTGKSLSMEKVKEVLVNWADESGFQAPDILSVNCTSLSNTSDIFGKILDKIQPRRKLNCSTAPLQYLQKMFSEKQQPAGTKMLLIVADELDYLITKDRVVLHELFMLTTSPFSRFILIGIANAIDLADKFLPKLQSMNCKPAVITFRAYSKDQIISILQQRFEAFPYTVFQPQALELCARKVASASGDMRKALWVCRSAIEMLEAEIRDSISSLDLPSLHGRFSYQQRDGACDKSPIHESNVVRVDHVAIALSKAYRSPVVDTIQSLPQHQQIILCSAVKLFRGKKKDATIGELNISYLDVCKSTLIPPVGIMELSSMCRVLGDQGILKVGKAREEKLSRVTLKVDEADITFALQGIRFFRNCLQQV